MSGCPSRKEVQAELWEQSGLPADLCDKMPELKQYGIYRKLDDDSCKKIGKPPGCVELLSYCTTIQNPDGSIVPAVQNYISILTEKFNNFLDQLLPQQNSIQSNRMR